MITPVTKDYELYLGSTFLDRFVWWMNNDTETEIDTSRTVTTGQPIDLSHAIIRSQWRSTKIPDTEDPSNLILSLDSSKPVNDSETCRTGIFIDNPKVGSFYILIDKEETSKIDYNTYRTAYYDMEIEVDGYVYTVMNGKIKFRPQITIE